MPRTSAVFVALSLILPLTSCQSADPAKVAACNRPGATLDDPTMQDCYLVDRTAHERMVAKKNAAFKERLAVIEADAKLHPEKYNVPRAPSLQCRGTVVGGTANMTCY